LGKEKLPYTSLLIAKPVEFSGEFELRIRSREKGVQVMENAVEAMREEAREVLDGFGMFDEGGEKGPSQQTWKGIEELVAKVEKKVEEVAKKGKLELMVRDEEMEMRVEGWREKVGQKVEVAEVKLENEKVTSDQESLGLLNECWGKN